MIMVHHRNVPAPGLIVALGLIAALSALPVQADALPPNVMDRDLGDATSSLSIRPLRVPYYAGDTLILEVTIRNTGTKARSYLGPRGLCVGLHPAPDNVWPPVSLLAARHECGLHYDRMRGELGTSVDKWYVDKITTTIPPGEARTAHWTSGDIGHRDHLPLEGQSPRIFGVSVSSHDDLPGRWFRFSAHRFVDPIRGQLLEHPVHKSRSFFFTAPGGPGRFVVLSHGVWWPHQGPWMTFDAATLNREAEQWTFTEEAIVSHPDPVIAYDVDGTLLVDGVRTKRAHWQFDHLGWAKPPWAPPDKPVPRMEPLPPDER